MGRLNSPGVYNRDGAASGQAAPPCPERDNRPGVVLPPPAHGNDTAGLLPERRHRVTEMTNDSAPITRGLVLRSHARYYDLVLRLSALGHGRPLQERVVELANLAPGEKVLDVGCGTGSLALAAKARVGPRGAVYGIDASAQMLERASRKARRRGLEIHFRTAAAEALPFPDHGFDVVFSTLMLHHLPRAVRLRCMKEARRVLRPGGRLLVADFQQPSRRHGGWLARLHRHGAVTRQEVLALLADAGFEVRVDQADFGKAHVTQATWSGGP